MSDLLPESIRGSLAYLLAKAHQRQLTLFEAHTASFAISGRDFAVMLALEANDGLWQSDIAALLTLDRTTVTYLVDALEQRSWARRERDPADRRAHVIRLTQDGVEALNRIRPAVTAAVDDLLAPLAEHERTQLRALLKLLVAT